MRVLLLLVCAALAHACAPTVGDDNELSSFRLVGPGIAAPIEATIHGTEIDAVVPHDAHLPALIAIFYTAGPATVTVNGVAQRSGATMNDFRSPVVYDVTDGEGSTRRYTVRVTLAESTAKEIRAFSFEHAHNPGLDADVTAVINGSLIIATVPFGTDVTALVPTFEATSENVTIGGTVQASGTTARDFSHPVGITVTAADGSTRTYTVAVGVASSSAKSITSYAFLATANTGLAADVVATINGTEITATVPYGTNVSALVATFQSTGTSVAINGVTQTSGSTPNGFAQPRLYTVTAADGTTRQYWVTVTVAASPAKDITSFAFLSSKNGSLLADVQATINGTAIAATVPYGTPVYALVASFQTTGASVAVGGAQQASGVTANDFTAPVPYVVTAGDGSTRMYTVTVTIAPNPAKSITSFSFLSAKNPALGVDVTGTINSTWITVTVPYGADITSLVATFQTTGATVTVAGVTQTSGATANNFSSIVQYLVTAGDGSTRVYYVSVTIAANPAKDITSFAFLSAKNSGLAADIIATINGTSITASVPYGTDVTALIATYQTTGQNVAANGYSQTSGATANNFTNPVAYRVYAADNTTKTYTVTVTVAPSPAKDITSFVFLSYQNAALVDTVFCYISGTSIAAMVPYGTDISALVATFQTTGVSVKINGLTITSGATFYDYTNQVVLTVTAADGSTKNYVVTILIAPSPSKDITSFAFLSTTNPGFGGNITATIEGNAITALVPTGTNVSNLVATFQTTGASVSVNLIPQTSGASANNFSNPVMYTVTAADQSSQTYTVTVKTFATKSDLFAVNPMDVAEGDLNADGKLDLVIAASGASYVSVYLNTTAPGATIATFGTRVDYLVGSVPAAVVIADVNADGRPDFAAANRGTGWNSVSVYLNFTQPFATAPSFASRRDFPTGVAPTAIAAGDVNADGKIDLMTANMDPNTMSVLLSTTSPGASLPTFATKVDFSTGASPRSLAVADLDGDGRLDVAVANQDSTAISVLLGTTAAGSMTPTFMARSDFATGAMPSSIAIGDLNLDGKLDLAVANYAVGTVSVLLNTTAAPGAVSFAGKVDFDANVSIFANVQSIAIGNLDGDGRPDLAVTTADRDQSAVAVLCNMTAAGSSMPAFTSKVTFSTGAGGLGDVAIGDLDGNGAPDLAATTYASTIAVLLAR